MSNHNHDAIADGLGFDSQVPTTYAQLQERTPGWPIAPAPDAYRVRMPPPVIPPVIQSEQPVDPIPTAHGPLEARVHALEADVADLRCRFERLEQLIQLQRTGDRNV